MKNIFSIITIFLFSVHAFGTPPVTTNKTNDSLINQRCPDFVFDSLLNYAKAKLALSDLRGKYVIIDFWGTFCVPCINDIPKIEQIQKRFGDSLQVLMVATDGWERAKQFYDTRKKGNKPMYLPCAISRNTVKYFQIREVSTYVWIDDQGYIKGITDDTQLTDRNVADFVRGKKVQFRQKGKEVIIDRKKLLVATAKEMDSNSVLYYSALTRNLKGVRSGYFPVVKGRASVNVTNMPVSNLYQIAFGDSTGAVPFNRTVVESAHPEKIALPDGEDFEAWSVDNTYCYELTVPQERQKDILEIMKEELHRIFGLNVFREYRTKQCLILKQEKEPAFFTAGNDTPKLAMSLGGVSIKNYPFYKLTELLQHYQQRIILLDETGITGNVDVALQAQMNDVDALNAALKKYGLHLQWEDRKVLMLVIKDPR